MQQISNREHAKEFRSKNNPRIVQAVPNNLKDFIVLHNLIVVEPQMKSDVTESGLYIPGAENMVDDSVAWRCVQVGPETVNIKPSDWVIIGKTSPENVVHLKDDEGEERMYYVFAENWVVGIFTEDGRDVFPSPHSKAQLKNAGIEAS